MHLNIKNDEAHKLATELARLTGESLTSAVTLALRERLARERRRRNVDAIVAQARSVPGTSVERHPVTLKEIFLEHVRSN